jgi:hypothetical protein
MLRITTVAVLAGLFCACGSGTADTEIPAPDTKSAVIANSVSVSGQDAALEEIAELERSGGFVPGLGLAEANLREQTGDYAGAVLAVFKELSWAYSRGDTGVSAEAIAEGLGRTAGMGSFPGAQETARAASAFFEGRWEDASAAVEELFGEGQEHDGFSVWMRLVCSIERGNVPKEIKNRYSSMRARYAVFPEYWYRGARCFYGEDIRIAASWSERCVDLAPDGPYAAECRSIIAESAGLDRKDGPAIKTRSEIETIVSAAIRSQNSVLLKDLFPLVSLPDNPYTLYASGALRSLVSGGYFKIWFDTEASRAKGRLAERLMYIARG